MTDRERRGGRARVRAGVHLWGPLWLPSANLVGRVWGTLDGGGELEVAAFDSDEAVWLPFDRDPGHATRYLRVSKLREITVTQVAEVEPLETGFYGSEAKASRGSVHVCAEEVAKAYKALYPEELLERYNAGERNFQGINLLRAELEHIFASGSSHPWVDPMLLESETYNPLWADFHDPDRRFEWDLWGRFIPIEYDDLLPPRDLAGVNLSGVNLAGAYLYPVDLSNANLSGADLREAKLVDANLQRVDLSRADLRGSLFDSTNLFAANLYMTRLERATLTSCDLREANLRRAKLRKAVVVAADLRGADLKKAHFHRTWLNGADLRHTDLQDVELCNVYVTGVTISASQQAGFLRALGIRCRG